MTPPSKRYAGTNPTADEVFGPDGATPVSDGVPRTFTKLRDGAYQLALFDLGISFQVDRLRRDRHELVGELTVCCDLAGARTVDGVLSVADFNFSSLRARQDRAKYCAERARDKTVDWLHLLEEFVHRVLSSEREGSPAVVLADLPEPVPDENWTIDRLPLLSKHPMILFGDGGTAKSYLALYLAGNLTIQGKRVALFDWELGADEHRHRLGRLFGSSLPRVVYVRCDQPLHYEADRLRRVVMEHQIQYAIFDSVAFACDGPPESAEVAARYYRAVRQIGGGSLHIAHVTKAEDGDQKPFGSAFWHNGARASWFCKRSDTDDLPVVRVGLYNRKANLGRLQRAVGFQADFSDECTKIRQIDLAETADLAERLPLWQRVKAELSRGPLTVSDIAERLGAKPDSIQKVVRRDTRRFLQLAGQGVQAKISLVART